MVLDLIIGLLISYWWNFGRKKKVTNEQADALYTGNINYKGEDYGITKHGENINDLR